MYNALPTGERITILYSSVCSAAARTRAEAVVWFSSVLFCSTALHVRGVLSRSVRFRRVRRSSNVTAASGGHIRAAPHRAAPSRALVRWAFAGFGPASTQGRRVRAHVLERVCARIRTRRDTTRAHPNNSTKRSSYRRGGGRARSRERRAVHCTRNEGPPRSCSPRGAGSVRFGSNHLHTHPAAITSRLPH